MRINTKTNMIAGLCVLALAMGVTTNAQENDPNQAPPKAPAEVDVPTEPEGLALPAIDANDPTLVAASQVEPVDPERVKALVPENLSGMQRVDLEGQLFRLGNAGMTTVRAVYADDAGNMLLLEIIDPGGLPMSEPKFLPLLPAGTTRDGEAARLEGMMIEGHPTVLETLTTPGKKRLQVGVGPRMRVMFESTNFEPSQLSGYASSLDLNGLAGLIR